MAFPGRPGCRDDAGDDIRESGPDGSRRDVPGAAGQTADAHQADGDQRGNARQAALFDRGPGPRSRRWTGTGILGRTGAHGPTGAARRRTGSDRARPATRAASTDRDAGPGPWAEAFVRVVVEILTGRRPVDQIANLVSAEPLTALRQAMSERTVPDCSIASVHVTPQASTGASGVAVRAVDLRAVLRFGYADRARALVGRLESTDGYWRCVELQLVGGLPRALPDRRGAAG